MKGVHPGIAASLLEESAVRNEAAEVRTSRIKLIVLWLAVLLPLCYGVYEELQRAKQLFE